MRGTTQCHGAGLPEIGLKAAGFDQETVKAKPGDDRPGPPSPGAGSTSSGGRPGRVSRAGRTGSYVRRGTLYQGHAGFPWEVL